jgi:DMSO/TMAO reductase YedYZ molybdopterin-dependent catalytic subunit
VVVPTDFEYSELEKFGQITIEAVLECAGNGRKEFADPVVGEVQWGHGAVGNASWSGIPLRDILRKVKANSEASEILVQGLDKGLVGGEPSREPFVRSLAYGKALERTTIIALRMNGKVLTPEHGFPARLLVPGWYGMASVKWIQQVTVRCGPPSPLFFNSVKYVYTNERDGRTTAEPVRELRVKSLITFPTPDQEVTIGKRLVISGKAWSGFGRIVNVEVKIGRGPWKEARLSSTKSKYGWTAWHLTWTPSHPGTNVILSRATDDSGNMQPETPMENKYQYGFNSFHRISLVVS